MNNQHAKNVDVDMESYYVRFTICDPDRNDLILKICTFKSDDEALAVSSPTGHVIKISKSKKTNALKTFLRAIGCTVQELKDDSRHGKLKLGGFTTIITPYRNNWKKGAVVQVLVTVPKYDEKGKEKVILDTQKKLMVYFSHYGIPVDRICLDSQLACDMKFGEKQVTASRKKQLEKAVTDYDPAKDVEE